MTTSPLTLTYARDDSRRLRKWARREFVLAWVGVTLYLAYDRWSGPAALRVQFWKEQRRCLQYAEPPDRVVFDSNPPRTTPLGGLPGYRGGSPMEALLLDNAAPPPKIVTLSAQASDLLAHFIAARDDVNSRETLLDLQPSDPTGNTYRGTFVDEKFVVMMHRRTPARGAAALVVIYANWRMGRPPDPLFHQVPEAVRPTERDYITFDAAIIPAGPLADVSQPIEPALVAGVRLMGTQRVRFTEPRHWLRLYAGQPHAHDAAHFSVDYETERGRGTVDGELLSDRTVRMRVVSGPFIHQPPVDEP